MPWPTPCAPPAGHCAACTASARPCPNRPRPTGGWPGCGRGPPANRAPATPPGCGTASEPASAAAVDPAGGLVARHRPLASRTLLHGAPSLGWLVPTPWCGGAVLLTGEEVTVGEPAGDLGWLLGELAELRGAAARGLGGAARHRPGDFTEPARALLEGYLGPGPHPALPEGTARHATLRLATHMHDYAAYVGWHDDLTAYADLLAEFLDAHGEPALHW